MTIRAGKVNLLSRDVEESSKKALESITTVIAPKAAPKKAAVVVEPEPPEEKRIETQNKSDLIIKKNSTFYRDMIDD